MGGQNLSAGSPRIHNPKGEAESGKRQVSGIYQGSRPGDLQVKARTREVKGTASSHTAQHNQIPSLPRGSVVPDDVVLWPQGSVCSAGKATRAVTSKGSSWGNLAVTWLGEEAQSLG